MHPCGNSRCWTHWRRSMHRWIHYCRGCRLCEWIHHWWTSSWHSWTCHCWSYHLFVCWRWNELCGWDKRQCRWWHQSLQNQCSLQRRQGLMHQWVRCSSLIAVWIVKDWRLSTSYGRGLRYCLRSPRLRVLSGWKCPLDWSPNLTSEGQPSRLLMPTLIPPSWCPLLFWLLLSLIRMKPIPLLFLSLVCQRINSCPKLTPARSSVAIILIPLPAANMTPARLSSLPSAWL